jgi:hypothetical protein
MSSSDFRSRMSRPSKRRYFTGRIARAGFRIASLPRTIARWDVVRRQPSTETQPGSPVPSRSNRYGAVQPQSGLSLLDSTIHRRALRHVTGRSWKGCRGNRSSVCGNQPMSSVRCRTNARQVSELNPIFERAKVVSSYRSYRRIPDTGHPPRACDSPDSFDDWVLLCRPANRRSSGDLLG